MRFRRCSFYFFFFNDTATTEIYTLSLHDALPISGRPRRSVTTRSAPPRRLWSRRPPRCSGRATSRSEEHTSELQSRLHLVCRLLLEKKKTKTHYARTYKRSVHSTPDSVDNVNCDR